jgi:hypothetical protein
MSHLSEKITVSNKRDLEQAIFNEYGQVTVADELGKQLAKLYDKKFYEGGETVNEKFESVSTQEVVKDQSIYFVLVQALTGFILTRNDLREYDSAVKGDTVVITHKRSK